MALIVNRRGSLQASRVSRHLPRRQSVENPCCLCLLVLFLASLLLLAIYRFAAIGCQNAAAREKRNFIQLFHISPRNTQSNHSMTRRLYPFSDTFKRYHLALRPRLTGEFVFATFERFFRLGFWYLKSSSRVVTDTL